MYLHDDKETFTYLVAETKREFSLQGNNAIKDYFIYVFLKELIQKNPSLIFKGGTALSKCYGIIDRFSEDIDLGMEASKTTEGQRKEVKRAVVTAAKTLRLEISNVDETRSKRSFNRYFIPITSDEPLRNELMVETALMTPVHPTDTKNISNFIYEYCIKSKLDNVIKQFGLAPFPITVSALERTFADKVYAICDYYLADRAFDRQSRHIYDLYKLLFTVKLDEDMASLLEKVRQDREVSKYCPSAQPEINLSELLTEIIDSRAYEKDYNNVTYPLLYENVSYNEAIKSLEVIAGFIGNSSKA